MIPFVCGNDLLQTSGYGIALEVICFPAVFDNANPWRFGSVQNGPTKKLDAKRGALLSAWFSVTDTVCIRRLLCAAC